jgi:flavodoxin
MKIQIMTDSQFGNGKILAETLKNEFSSDDVSIADVKDITPNDLMDNVPDVFILGGAVRMFMSDKKSKKWLKEYNKLLEKSGKKIQYATGFLTHGLPTDKVQGFARKYMNAIEKNSMIDKTYTELLTARVEGQEGPIFPEEIEKAKAYIKDFIAWLK